jgi:hypothetical protein
MADNNELRLFGGDGLTGYLAAKLASVCSLADRITHADLLAASPAALAQAFVEQLSVAPLVLQLEQMKREQVKIEIGRVKDTRDYGKVVKREVMVPGFMMHYLIPFTGDPQLWLLNNGPFLAYQGHLDAEQRILTLTLRNTVDVASTWYQRQMEETMKDIDRHLSDQARVLTAYRLELAEAVERAVARRGQQLRASGA